MSYVNGIVMHNDILLYWTVIQYHPDFNEYIRQVSIMSNIRILKCLIFPKMTGSYDTEIFRILSILLTTKQLKKDNP